MPTRATFDVPTSPEPPRTLYGYRKMTGEERTLFADALAWLAGPNALNRAQMVKILRYGSDLTETDASEVIDQGLRLALLVEDPTNPTHLRAAPKSAPRRRTFAR